MLGKILFRLLNIPGALAYVAAHRQRSEWDPSDDIELRLYAQIAQNDFLHYGYFDPIPAQAEDISLNDVRAAMDAYGNLLAGLVPAGQRVLDIGCGMGGLLNKLQAKGCDAHGVTPNQPHVQHIRQRYPQVTVYESRFEEVQPSALGQFDVLMNAESFQYLELDRALALGKQLLKPGGCWFILDYFCLNDNTKNKSGHVMATYRQALQRQGWRIVTERDLTENMLPTLAYGHLLAGRLMLPLVRHTADRFFLKHPYWAYVFGNDVRQKLAEVKLHTLDPQVFRAEKRYVLFELEAV